MVCDGRAQRRYRVVNADERDVERWEGERRDEEEGRRWAREGWGREEVEGWRGEFDWVGMVEREKERFACERAERERAEMQAVRRMLRRLGKKRMRGFLGEAGGARRKRRTVTFRHQRRKGQGRAERESDGGKTAAKCGGGRGARAIVTEVISLEDDLETDVARAERWLAMQGACM